jgi:hypothetical protein
MGWKPGDETGITHWQKGMNREVEINVHIKHGRRLLERSAILGWQSRTGYLNGLPFLLEGNIVQKE